MRSFLRAVLAAAAGAVGLLAALPVVLLGLPFWLVSATVAGARKLGSAFRPETSPWQDLMEFEPEVGWKPMSGLDAYAEGDRVFHLTTDADGWRGKRTLEEADVLVLGDSFAFGHGIDDRHFFADLDSDVRIKAVGANGYSMVHCLLWMRRLAPRLEGKLVVWLVYYGNDLSENLRPNLGSYRMPFVRSRNGTGEWDMVVDHVSPEPWPFSEDESHRRSLAEICSSTHLTRRVFDACDHLIGEARACCVEAGARLVVMGVPDIWQLTDEGRSRLVSLTPAPESFDPDLPDRELGRVCAENEVPFVSLRDELDRGDFKENDCHWNRRGHRRVARLIDHLHESYGGDWGSGAIASRNRTKVKRQARA